MLLFRPEEESCFLVSVSSYSWQLPQGKNINVGSCPGLNQTTFSMRKIGPNGFGIIAYKCLFKYVFLLMSENFHWCLKEERGPAPTSHTLTV